MSDQPESPDTSPEDESSAKAEALQSTVKKKAAKKAAKKTSKKAAKKAAKKSVKKTAKKTAKKVAKKTAKKAASKKVESEEQPDLPGIKGEAADEHALKSGSEDSQTNPIPDAVGDSTAPDSDVSMAPKVSLEQDGADEMPEIKEVVEKPQKATPPPPPPPEVPDLVDLNGFREQPLAELFDEIRRLKLRIPAQPTKAQLIFSILSCYATHGTRVVGSGVLEMVNDSFGLLRDPRRSFRAEPDDLYLPAQLIKEYGLRDGHLVEVAVRAPRPKDKYLSAEELLTVEGQPLTDFQSGTPFDFLTSLFPEERFVMEGQGEAPLSVRLVDLVAPLGKGQRGLIVAPPRGGKTILLKQIAKALQNNHPDAELIVLLLDERPEEVTDFEEMVGENVFASTFDEPSKRHAQVANVVLERARRLVEQKKDVVILLDSLTRLARGYNNAIKGGPIGSGGLSPKAIAECRKFFGAARNVEQGGSLTILATCLIETENRMDDIIFEELKGTGNMEIRLDRILAEQRIYPAIHLPQSGTRNDDRLYHEQELPRVLDIRRELAALPVGEALEHLLANLKRTENNAGLLLQGLR